MDLINRKTDLIIKCLISILPISILIGPSVSIINISIISLLGLIVFIRYEKEFSLFENKSLRLFFLLYLYLIFNTFISLSYEESLNRNLGFVRYIFLFIAINFLFYKNQNNTFLFNIWIIVFLIVFFDIFYEFYNGKNILGYPSLKNRIASFFKDEAIIGSFLIGFIFMLAGYLLNNYGKDNFYKNFFIFSFLFVSFVCVIFTGERSSTIKFVLGFFLFFFLIKKTNYIYLITILAALIVLISANFSHFKVLKIRFYDDIVPRLMNNEMRKNYLYFQLYSSGIEVFKKYPIFGVGNKNYRVETCKPYALPVIGKENQKYKCNTHPHQVYVEFLSEHGLIGSLIIFYVLISMIFSNFKNVIRKKNLIQIGCFCYLMVSFVPLIPSGSFFSDFNSTFFFINLSLYLAVNPETNIFKKIDN